MIALGIFGIAAEPLAAQGRTPIGCSVVFERGGVRFGLMTCYDLRFPELSRSRADAGAQVLLVCSS